MNVTMTDISGKVVKTGTLNAETLIIETNELPSGVYILNISNNGQNANFKVIK
jgi:hypothetical protein